MVAVRDVQRHTLRVLQGCLDLIVYEGLKELTWGVRVHLCKHVQVFVHFRPLNCDTFLANLTSSLEDLGGFARHEVTIAVRIVTRNQNTNAVVHLVNNLDSDFVSDHVRVHLELTRSHLEISNCAQAFVFRDTCVPQLNQLFSFILIFLHEASDVDEPLHRRNTIQILAQASVNRCAIIPVSLGEHDDIHIFK